MVIKMKFLRILIPLFVYLNGVLSWEEFGDEEFLESNHIRNVLFDNIQDLPESNTNLCKLQFAYLSQNYLNPKIFPSKYKIFL